MGMWVCTVRNRMVCVGRRVIRMGLVMYTFMEWREMEMEMEDVWLVRIKVIFNTHIYS